MDIFVLKLFNFIFLRILLCFCDLNVIVYLTFAFTFTLVLCWCPFMSWYFFVLFVQFFCFSFCFPPFHFLCFFQMCPRTEGSRGTCVSDFRRDQINGRQRTETKRKKFNINEIKTDTERQNEDEEED